MIETLSSSADNTASNPFGYASGDILIVDDNPDNLRLLTLILSQRGYEVRKALSGRMAIASAQATAPDLILLDVRMPEMDGYQVCEQLRANPQTADIPVIFISALSDLLDRVKAFAAGGADFITKPFHDLEIVARIEHQLRIRRLQKQLVKHNEELLRSNRELEQFAYVVSHDLQQPLQSIIGFTKIMMMQYQTSLDEEAKQYLNSIEAATHRMHRLIVDTLDYARIDLEAKTSDPVDCNRVIQQAIENLHSAIVTTGATLKAEPLPTVIASETLLVQLFQNLLSNALKFTRSGVPPQVRIAADLKSEYWQFVVQDNGIGIAAKDFSRIFEAFQRLQRQYEGTGIGLATCRKIVEAQGGTIWVESQPGAGTSFYFTLPAARL